MIDPYAVSPRTKVRRMPERSVYDRDAVHAIIDAAPICHVGLADPDGPIVIPMLHARIDDTLYLHGSPASRLLRTVAAGAPACLTFTLLDGIVLARSAMHHSLNYRSAVVFGTGRAVDDPDEKWRSFEALVEQAAPGRWAEIRQPSDLESRATSIVAIQIDHASAKVRAMGVKEEGEDLSIWAGVVPLSLAVGPPRAEPDVARDAPLPPSVHALLHRGRYR